MHRVAYLVNRYPETTLTAIRREIRAVADAGLTVLRFAHRPSEQPLASDLDRCEACLTDYLAVGGATRLATGLIATATRRPLRFASALRSLVAIDPGKLANLGYLALACAFHGRLKREGVEHLHVHFGLTSAVVAMLVRKLGGPSWTMTVHGPEEFEPHNSARLARLAVEADAIVAISESCAVQLRGVCGNRLADVVVISMGVDASYLAPPAPIRADGPVLCLARLDKRKGHGVLLEALQALCARHPSLHVELIGDGPLRGRLEDTVAHLSLSGCVTFRGWLDQGAVLRELDLARFVVLPSLSEGLPVAIMEALARARPVIATRVAAVSELIIDQVNGLLVDPGNAQALAGAIERLHTTPPEHLFELGNAGRKTVSERFDSGRNARALVALWKRLGLSES